MQKKGLTNRVKKLCEWLNTLRDDIDWVHPLNLAMYLEGGFNGDPPESEIDVIEHQGNP